jgi:hypothetical protein
VRARSETAIVGGVSRRSPRAALVGAVLLILLPSAAGARQVTVPLPLDPEFLRQALVTQVYTGADQSVRMWDDGSGCNFLILSNPRVEGMDGRLRVISDGKGRVGTAVGDNCLTLIDWQGRVEVDEEPSLDPSLPIVRFRVVDSDLYAEGGGKRVTGTLWDWVKSYVHPRLETVILDLHQPIDELRAFLPLVLPSTADTTLQDSLRLSAVSADAEGLRVELAFEVADRTPVMGPPAPEPTLTAEELAAWEASWQQWDAFLTFVAKQGASDTPLAADRQALFDVLIEARYDLVEVLAPAAPHTGDPVPDLFLKTWPRLAPVLRQLSFGLPGEAALRYLSFVTAADALRTLDTLGPEIGVEISADGLRRLARIVAPASTEDPLFWSDEVDPQLRELFGFGTPLPPPEDNPAVDLSVVSADEAVCLGGRTLVSRAVSGECGSASLALPGSACAPDDEPLRLNNWVPTRADLSAYLPLVRDLLLHSAALALAKKSLDAAHRDVYRWLVLSTAWKESCWRQFVRVGGSIKPMLSPVGAVGIMQVLPRVWRGFYDVKGLHRDIAYNAMAGAEILLHYLRDYAIARGEHTATGQVDNLARATYAVYNGGPGHLRRYRKDKVSRSLRKIDQSFWEKYLKVKKGNELAVAECFGP